MPALLFIAVAYLIGSLSFAVIVSRAMRLPDPRQYGSGNPGATNVLRTGRKTAAALTLLGDALKGWVVVVPACAPAPPPPSLSAHRPAGSALRRSCARCAARWSRRGCQSHIAADRAGAWRGSQSRRMTANRSDRQQQ